MMNLESIKKICVVGWGKSGMALCQTAAVLGKRVHVTEMKAAVDFHPYPIEQYRMRGVEFEFGGHTKDAVSACGLVVLSPGVDPLTSPAVEYAREHGIPCMGEIEFAYQISQARWVAITGTAGKTTTTFLTYQALKKKYPRTRLGGNIGIPVSSFVLDTQPGDIIVLEISSFQLETTIGFQPFVASILNINANHLDRHPTFEDYMRAKLSIFKNQTENDWAVLPASSPYTAEMARHTRAQIAYFGDEYPNPNHACAHAIARVFGVSRDQCDAVFSSFKGLPHRMQYVRQVRGVSFINDSKSTTPASTIWALTTIPGSVILLAGGKDKGVAYQDIVPYLGKVKKIVVFGQAAEKITEALSGFMRIEKCSDLRTSVRQAFASACPGDTVVLSPMCASFDMFKNYMDRGRQFVQLVQELPESSSVSSREAAV